MNPSGRVDLAGILWGSSTFAGGSFVMSAMENIRFEFPGPWATH